MRSNSVWWCSGESPGEGTCWGMGLTAQGLGREQEAETQIAPYSAAPPRAGVQGHISLSRGTPGS